MHWKTWDFLCEPKCRGGLGFRKLDIFNKALLAKQLWRIIQNPSSLVARVLKGRYFKHMDVMLSPLGSNPSFVWRSLIWSRSLLKEGLCWRIGDGKGIDVMRERWIPSKRSKLTPCELNVTVGAKVSSLIIDGSWNEQLIKNVCLPHLVQDIISAVGR
ncbi:uncharacterized mitochondrial protein AtMg00310-like [Henckelia pumila]|uniref:uncharacterized mitochondrial protein AtMg00310-like n=1 Tax=Henckelia pumila TaxID=405737 RepID=UPI003C6E32E3